MNREIKFRIWDKWKKEMIQPKGGDFIGWHSPSNWKDVYEIMQFTGLRDKNGVEIYEGYIIIDDDGFKYKPVQLNEANLGVDDFGITYKAICWCVEHKDLSGVQALLNSSLGRCYGLDCYEVEVIGNIYENPELLK